MWDLEKFGENLAILDDSGSSVTYSQLSEACNKLSFNIGNRCLIVILCRNSISSITGYVACINNRVVPLLLNADLDYSAISKLIEDYCPKYVWAPRDYREITDFKEVYTDGSYTLLKNGRFEEYPLFEELALLITTSGSTGSPKFVRQSYENIKSNTESIIDYLSIVPSDRAITTLPMNYTYGLSIINTHLYAGATLLVTDLTLMQKDFWTFLKEQNATTFGGVPYTYEMLHRLRFERMNLPSLRYLTQAGGKLSIELQKEYAAYSLKTGIPFVIMYGQCEATARMSYLPPNQISTHLGSIGVPIPGGQFKIISTEGVEITSAGTPGELEYLGHNVTLGYAISKNDLSKGDERNGVLLTGDIAQFDEEGFYYIVGRMKRFLKVYGNRVNLDELEQILKNRFVGIDCAISGQDDHIVIFITGDETPSELVNYLAHTTGLNRVSFKVK